MANLTWVLVYMLLVHFAKVKKNVMHFSLFTMGLSVQAGLSL